MQVDELFRRMVIDAVVDDAKVDVPQVMIDRRVGTILQQMAAQLPEGVNIEQYIAASGRTVEQIVEELRPDAEMAVRRELVVEAVAQAAQVEVTDEEMEAQVRLRRRRGDLPPPTASCTSCSTMAGRASPRQDMRLQKAVQQLVDHAKPIPMAQAQAREKLWTPEDDRKKAAATAEAAGKPAPREKAWHARRLRDPHHPTEPTA